MKPPPGSASSSCHRRRSTDVRPSATPMRAPETRRGRSMRSSDARLSIPATARCSSFSDWRTSGRAGPKTHSLATHSRSRWIRPRPTASSVSLALPFARTASLTRGARRTRCSSAFRPTPTRCWWPDSRLNGKGGCRTRGDFSSAHSRAKRRYVDVHVALGRVEASAGRRAEARRHFERALELDPSRRNEIAVWLERTAGPR